jgi:hypothetical protein
MSVNFDLTPHFQRRSFSMTHPRRRLSVEALEDRCTPGGFSFNAPPALARLSAVAARFPTDPIRVSPVFVLNFNTSATDTLHALNGLTKAGTHLPGDPIIPPNPIIPGKLASPVFYGLAHQSVDW